MKNTRTELENKDRNGIAFHVGTVVRATAEDGTHVGRVAMIGWGPWLGIVVVSFAEGELIPFNRLEIEVVEQSLFEHRESSPFELAGAA